ncbi:MAG TPA: peptidoglycan-binding protein, partial [Gammaproteobacteria bacterium]|nr:peptidoglycan-binding protein [Gammaproteobacteria bacterium]
GVSQIGQHDVVVLNLGTSQGMERGHVLAVYQTGETIEDPVAEEEVKLPDERAGAVMVFRTFDRVSYALVMRATRTMHVLDTVTNP